MSNAADSRLPDLVEVEIGSIGNYFRPPVDDVGFLPLNDYLEKSGYADRILKSQFAPGQRSILAPESQLFLESPMMCILSD